MKAKTLSQPRRRRGNEAQTPGISDRIEPPRVGGYSVEGSSVLWVARRTIRWVVAGLMLAGAGAQAQPVAHSFGFTDQWQSIPSASLLRATD